MKINASSASLVALLVTLSMTGCTSGFYKSGVGRDSTTSDAAAPSIDEPRLESKGTDPYRPELVYLTSGIAETISPPDRLQWPDENGATTNKFELFTVKPVSEVIILGAKDLDVDGLPEDPQVVAQCWLIDSVASEGCILEQSSGEPQTLIIDPMIWGSSEYFVISSYWPLEPEDNHPAMASWIVLRN